MSSAGAVNKAPRSLDNDASSANGVQQDYRIVLPALPKESLGRNAVILHADITGRPYRIQDFKPALKDMLHGSEIAQLGAYQMNHVWLLTTSTPEAKEKLLKHKECVVKGKKCILVDVYQKEVTLKVFWLPFNVSNAQVQVAFQCFGKVLSVEREKWRDEDLGHVETTTRMVKLVLHDEVSSDKIPHMMRVGECQVLVSVPGRPRLCLRCREEGHIRQHCRTPRCTTCRRFGHVTEDCLRSYAQITKTAQAVDEEVIMDQEEADATTACEENIADNNTLRDVNPADSPALPRLPELSEVDWSTDAVGPPSQRLPEGRHPETDSKIGDVTSQKHGLESDRSEAEEDPADMAVDADPRRRLNNRARRKKWAVPNIPFDSRDQGSQIVMGPFST